METSSSPSPSSTTICPMKISPVSDIATKRKIVRAKKPGPRAKDCPWCDQPNCRHCHCPGFEGCGHKPGETCSQDRYKRRLVCNPCEKHKLNYHRKLKGLPPKVKKKRRRKPKKGKKSIEEESRLYPLDLMPGRGGNRGVEGIDLTSPEFSTSPSDDLLGGHGFGDVLGGLGLNATDPFGATTGSSDKYGSGSKSSTSGDERFPSLDLEDLHDLLEDFDGSNARSFEPELILTSRDEGKPLSRKRVASDRSFPGVEEKEPEPKPISLCVGSDQTTDPVEDINRTDVLHLNVKYNPEAFGVVPINRDLDNLNYVREYVQKRLIHELDHRRFTFLSREGVEIKRDQENDLSAWDQTTARDWTHHTFGDVIRRYHLFVVMDDKEDSQQRKRRRRGPAGKDDENDEGDDDGNDEDVEDLFRESSEGMQEKLAWEFFSKYHGNIQTQGRKHRIPLLCAAVESGDLMIVRRLLKVGAFINAADENGNTAFHIAARNGDAKMLTLLLRAPIRSKTMAVCGVGKLNLANKDGETALDLATDDATRTLLKRLSYAPRVLSRVELSKAVDCSTVSLERVRRVLVDSFKALDVRFLVQGTVVRPSQEKDFRLTQCDWNASKDKIVFISEEVRSTTTVKKDDEDRKTADGDVDSKFAVASSGPKSTGVDKMLEVSRQMQKLSSGGLAKTRYAF